MSPGYQDLGTLGGILDFYHIQLDPLGGLEHLAFHLLVLGQHGVRLAQVDTDISSHIPLYDTGDNVFFFLKILIVDHFALFLANLLQDQVLGVLRSDPTKGFGLNRDPHDIAKSQLAVDLLSIFQADLLQRIFYFLHNLFLRVKLVITGLPIHGQLNVVRLAKMILAGIQKGILNGIQQSFLTDVLLLLQQVQCFQ